MLELHWGLNSDIILEKSVDYTKKALETKIKCFLNAILYKLPASQ